MSWTHVVILASWSPSDSCFLCCWVTLGCLSGISIMLMNFWYTYTLCLVRSGLSSLDFWGFLLTWKQNSTCLLMILDSTDISLFIRGVDWSRIFAGPATILYILYIRTWYWDIIDGNTYRLRFAAPSLALDTDKCEYVLAYNVYRNSLLVTQDLLSDSVLPIHEYC